MLKNIAFLLTLVFCLDFSLAVLYGGPFGQDNKRKREDDNSLSIPNDAVVKALRIQDDSHGAFYEALITNNLELVVSLLQNYKDFMNKNSFPLHMAIKNKRYEIAIIIISYMRQNTDAEGLNKVDAEGLTPMHLAVFNSALAVVNFLMDTSLIDISVRDKSGRTAFDYIFQGGM